MDFNAILAVINAIGREAMMELMKSKWVRFCVGAGILLLASPGFIRALVEALK